MAPRIRLYGLRHLRDKHAADDLTQQVLITTLEALRAGRLREPEKLASFVLGTCRMTVLDLRRGAQRKERLLEQFGADLLAPAPAPEPQLDHEQLARCVQNLKERERTVVIMTFYDEQTGADVSQFPGRFRSQCTSDSPPGDSPTTGLHGGCRMNCSNPIDAAVLADYWLAALAKSEEEAVEEHLFTCDECGARLARSHRAGRRYPQAGAPGISVRGCQ